MEKDNSRIMGTLSYLWVLVLIPLIADSETEFLRFHENQGLILFLFTTVLQILFRLLSKASVIGFIGSLLSAVSLILSFILTILGIVNVVNGEKKELPFIGKLRLLK